MQAYPWRITVFLAVAVALLNAGLYFQRGDIVATLYFMAGAILLTIATSIGVRRRAI